MFSFTGWDIGAEVVVVVVDGCGGDRTGGVFFIDQEGSADSISPCYGTTLGNLDVIGESSRNACMQNAS